MVIFCHKSVYVEVHQSIFLKSFHVIYYSCTMKGKGRLNNCVRVFVCVYVCVYVGVCQINNIMWFRDENTISQEESGLKLGGRYRPHEWFFQNRGRG